MTGSFALAPGEQLIAVGPVEEQLFRQITYPLLGEDGVPAAHAFGPQSADAGKPSYSRSTRVTAQQSRSWHTAHAAKPSLGVWAVTVEEVGQAGTVAIDDSGTPQSGPRSRAPGHCYVEFRHFQKREVRNVRAILLRFAIVRGEIPTQP